MTTHSRLCYNKQKKLNEKLRRAVTLEEVHLLCDELGFTDPAETMQYIETATAAEIENIISRAKRKKRRKHEGGYEYEYNLAYV